MAYSYGVDLSFAIAYFPGHYGSPLPSRDEVKGVAQRVFAEHDGNMPGIDLRYEAQLELYQELVKFYADWPYADDKIDDFRYYCDNKNFCHADGFWLFALLQHFKPKRIVEVGSGFSSCLMLDVNERYFNNTMQLTFIEPFPERLLSNIKPDEKKSINLLQGFVQDVDVACFTALEANDVLFIDSSHVGKVGSDVLYLFNNILPLLKKGVIIHIHDIFFPFEYPRDWIENRCWAWNECYFLRSFLQFNDHFETLLFGHWLGEKHSNLLMKHTPMCTKNIGGSFWMRKVK